MEWVQLIIFLATIVGLWFWQRTESRADNRRVEDWLKTQRELIAEVYKEGAEWRREMAKEQKDFHYRLLEIERNRK